MPSLFASFSWVTFASQKSPSVAAKFSYINLGYLVATNDAVFQRKLGTPIKMRGHTAKFHPGEPITSKRNYSYYLDKIMESSPC
ncbi:hypothetical protein PARA125_001104 [Parachlamydia sp. AcF125]|nr:hypothetical protein [Parachlamydia sp. AcF125]